MTTPATSDRDDLRVEVIDQALHLTLTRPQKKNAFTDAMYTRFAEALEQLAASDDLHCLVIRAEGDVFSAGNDLNDFLQQNGDGVGQPVIQVLHGLAAADKPLIAVVDGPAVGIGTTLLLHCDFVVATEAASFHAPFVQLGLVPEAGSSRLFPALLGHRRAMAMLVLGTPLSAAEALDCGLINRLVAAENLESSVAAIVERLRQLPSAAVRATKRLCRNPEGTLTEVIDREIDEFAARLRTPETRAAITAALHRKR